MYEKPEKIEEKIIFENPYRKVIEAKFKIKNGEIRDFILIGSNNNINYSTLIVPITKEKEIVYLEEFRYGPEKYIINFPFGMQEISLSKKENCKKELQEESGYISDKFIYLGQNMADGYSKVLIGNYIALDCEKIGNLELDNSEYAEVKKTSIENFDQMILDGKVECPFSISAYFFAKNRLKKNNFL